MEFNEVIIADIEADALLDRITKIHCLSVGYRDSEGRWAMNSTTGYENIKKMFTNPNNVIAGHNFAQYDCPAIERVLGIKITATILDTLAISYALFPGWKLGTFGLEDIGVRYGLIKKEITDWKNLTIDQYILRCESDIRINSRLWIDIEKKLTDLYGNDKKKAMAFCKYMTFKADCLREQEENPIHINVEKLEKTLRWMEKLKEEKIAELIPAMPKAVSSTKSKPAKMYKKNGDLSKAGQDWIDLLAERSLPADYEGEVEMYKTPNPNSSQQIKDWLFTLGWKPKIFNEGANGNQIPQIRNKDKELCKSVLKLAEKEPAIKALEGISVLTHRIGVLKSFQKHLRFDDTVVARASAFTNTLRLQHAAPVVNLPGVVNSGPEKNSFRDGRWIRGLMEAPEGYVYCNSDVKSLEDRTKCHQIYKYDKEYVEQMMTEGWDPHLDLCVSSGALTQEQADAHKRGEEDYSAVRHIYKTCNYAAVYGIGAKSLSKTIGKSVTEAQEILDSYWKRNHSVVKVAQAAKVKMVNGESWILNELNGFYYNLRSDKDRFSTLTQGGSTYIFDLWVLNLRKDHGIKIIMQYHDEINIYVEDNTKIIEETEIILKQAMQKVNKMLKLNMEQDVDVQFGRDYSETH